jgi:hypothetical protein
MAFTRYTLPFKDFKAWDAPAKVDEGRSRGSRKLRSANKNRALAKRYGLARYSGKGAAK